MKFNSGEYRLLMLISPIFLALAIISIAGVTNGEVQKTI